MSPMLIVRICLLYAAAALLAGSFAFAQNTPAKPDGVKTIREEVNRLLKENARLQEEFKRVQATMAEPNAKLAEKQKEIAELKAQFDNEVQKHNALVTDAANLRKEIKELEAEILIQKGRKAYSQGELIDTDENNRLLKLRLSELQLTKHDVEIGRKMKKFEYDKKFGSQKKTLDELRKKRVQLLEREKQVTGELKQLDDQSDAFESALEPRVKKNMALEKTIAEKTKAKSILETELELLNNKAELEDKTFEYDIRKRDQIRRNLQQEVDRLRAADEGAQLIRKINGLKEENAGLRNKIEDLKQQQQKPSLQIEP